METENKNQIVPTTLGVIEGEIKKAYAEANALALTAKQDARAAIMRLADCGEMILLGREQIKGSKTEWIESLGISADRSEKAVCLARNREQLELDLWPSDVAKLGAQLIGILPPHASAQRVEDDPERTTKVTTHWIAYVGKINNSFKQLFDSKPLSTWREDEKQNVKIALKPIFDLYQTLS
jgi:hypothetical protein